jgi:ribosomal protein S12 methylthiotransferase accessory factor
MTTNRAAGYRVDPEREASMAAQCQHTARGNSNAHQRSASKRMDGIILCKSDAAGQELRALLAKDVERQLLGVWTLDVLGESDRLSSLPKPLLVIRIEGKRVHVTRWEANGEPTCPYCFDRRIEALKQPEQLARQVMEALSVDASFLCAFAVDAIRHLMKSLESTRNREGYELSLVTLRARRFSVVPDSSCRMCLPRVRDSKYEASEWRLKSRVKLSPRSYRSLSARDLAIDAEKYVNPTAGAFGTSSIRDLRHPYGPRVSGSFLIDTGRRHHMRWSGGADSFKSSTVVGLCEAFERHAGLTMRAKTTAIRDSLNNLGETALDPRTCGIYERDYYKRGVDAQEFDSNAQIRWVWGHSLTRDRATLVPAQLAYYGLHLDDEPRFVIESSNGCATGSSIEEAILFALLEIIERDAFVMHWLNSISPPRIALNTIRSASLRFLIGRIERAKLDITLLDGRLDTAIPTIFAIVMRRDQGLGAFTIAASSHFNEEVAMESALRDAASHHVGFEERTKRAEDSLRAALRDFHLIRTIHDHGALYGLPEAVPFARFLTESPGISKVGECYEEWNLLRPATLDLRDDITCCLKMLSRSGLNEVVVIDQTSPEAKAVGLRTVKVIVPGALPIDFGYGRSRASSLPRLYSVPKLLGRSLKATRPDTLNRKPHPFA